MKLCKVKYFEIFFAENRFSVDFVFRGGGTFSDTVLDSTEIYNFFAIFGKK